MFSFRNLFQQVESFAKSLLKRAQTAGLTDEVVKVAVVWARVAEKKYLDNAERREWVVSILTARGIPESVARLAVELAVQALKAEIPDA